MLFGECCLSLFSSPSKSQDPCQMKGATSGGGRASYIFFHHHAPRKGEERGRRPGKSAIRGISFFASLGERVIDHGLNNLYPSQRMKTASSSSSDWGGEEENFLCFLSIFPWKRKTKVEEEEEERTTTLSDR